MNLLLLHNSFAGAHGSFSVFEDEMEAALRHLGHRVFRASSFKEIVQIAFDVSITCSLGIGQYGWTDAEGLPAYDALGLPHMQWLLDHPRKLRIDGRSPRIQYVVIDSAFASSMHVRRPVLSMPLGLPENGWRNPRNERKDSVLFPGQVRDVVQLRKELWCADAEAGRTADAYLEHMDDTSFFQIFSCYESNPVIWRLANSYIRAARRALVLRAIHAKPVVILGRVDDATLAPLSCFGSADYLQVLEIMETYRYVLNVDPNFPSCLHDRLLRAVQKGCRVITSATRIVQETFGSNVIGYRFDHLSDIDRLLEKDREPERSAAVRQTQERAGDFLWERELAFLLDYCARGGFFHEAMG